MDDARRFVRQLYYDFLNRMPDAGGLDYWIEQITSCGNDEVRIRSRRVAVADAFFFSQEYQHGAYVFRLYRAAYGNQQPFPNPDGAHLAEATKLLAMKFSFRTGRAS